MAECRVPLSDRPTDRLECRACLARRLGYPTRLVRQDYTHRRRVERGSSGFADAWLDPALAIHNFRHKDVVRSLAILCNSAMLLLNPSFPS